MREGGREGEWESGREGKRGEGMRENKCVRKRERVGEWESGTVGEKIINFYNFSILGNRLVKTAPPSHLSGLPL